jgi:hypothetical protein
MGEDPGRIRDEIAQTREQLAERPATDRMRDEFDENRQELQETMDALGHKADIKGRLKESVGGTKDAVVEKAQSAVGAVAGAIPGTDDVSRGARKVGISKQNPLGLAVGGVAVGFLVGLLLPSTSVEDEKLGDAADELKDRVAETGTKALEGSKQVAQETLEAARQTATEAVGRESKQLSSELGEEARKSASAGSRQPTGSS